MKFQITDGLGLMFIVQDLDQKVKENGISKKRDKKNNC